MGSEMCIRDSIDFPEYSDQELMEIAQKLLVQQNYRFDPTAELAFADYVRRRRELPFFANARSIRNAIDRMRLRQANRLFSRMEAPLSLEDLITIQASDILCSRVFDGEIEGRDPSCPLT